MTVTKEPAGSTTRTAPPPPRRGGEPPRRPMPAGHVILVALIALFVGSLLNAKGMLKTATGLNLESTRREMSLFFAKPLYRIAHFLHTDRPREWIQDAIGRGGDDDVAKVAGPSPTTTPPTSAPPPVPNAARPGQPVVVPPPPPKPVFDAAHPLRMYLAGDSLAATPDQEFINLVTGVHSIAVPNGVDFRISTGISRPDVFDWPSHILGESKSINPNVVMLTFGANDDQAIESPDGKVHSFGTPGWITEYRRRVGGLMDALNAQGRLVYWIGIPIVRDPARWQHYQLIDQVYSSEAAKRPGKVTYVDTTPLLAGPNGGYADYVTDASGQSVKIRAADGIHFERAGGRRIAQAVLDRLHARFDLRG
jgi:hypothetical protein